MYGTKYLWNYTEKMEFCCDTKTSLALFQTTGVENNNKDVDNLFNKTKKFMIRFFRTA